MAEVIKNGRNIDLNDDLIYEILQRVSLDTLERCRLASKKISGYIDSQLFLNSFYGRSDIFVGCINQFLRRRTHAPACFTPSTLYQKRNDPAFALSLGFLPDQRVKIKVCSSAAGGLFYCRSTNVHGPARSNYVCKPTTKQWVAIPNHETSFKTEAYAFVVKNAQPLQYLIIHFSKAPNMDSSDYTMFCEIFDSRTWSWRRTEDVKFEKSIALVKKEATTTYVKGAVHFLTCSQEIFAFDLTTEKWELKPLPQQIATQPDHKLYRHKLSQYRGKLNLCVLTVYTEESEHVQEWEMADYTKATWTKSHLRKGHTVALSQYDHSEWFYSKKTSNGSSYAEVKADSTNSLFFTQLLPFASDYEPVFLEPPTPPPPPPASSEQIDQA